MILKILAPKIDADCHDTGTYSDGIFAENRIASPVVGCLLRQGDDEVEVRQRRSFSDGHANHSSYAVFAWSISSWLPHWIAL